MAYRPGSATIEFLLVDAAGERVPGELWAQYGLAGVLEHEGFVRDVMAAMDRAGVGVEQFHPEYGVNQFEMSLAPASRWPRPTNWFWPGF